MEVRNCPQCGRVFTFIRTNLCPRCQDIEEEEFRKVRKYIAKNPGVGIKEVSEATEVDENKILRFIKEGRITTKSFGDQVEIRCEVCGTLVSSGRFCVACGERLTSGLKKSIEAERQKELEEIKREGGPRMHTINHLRDKS